MNINLTPQVRDDNLVITRKGDKLTINGRPYDFALLPEGAMLPAGAVDCAYVVGNVTRINGDLHITLLLPIHWDAPQSCTFPQPIINPPDGRIKLPTGEVIND